MLRRTIFLLAFGLLAVVYSSQSTAKTQSNKPEVILIHPILRRLNDWQQRK